MNRKFRDAAAVSGAAAAGPGSIGGLRPGDRSRVDRLLDRPSERVDRFDRLVVNLSACKYPLVREAAERTGYVVAQEEGETWDLFWSDLSVSSDRVQRLLPFQRLNHFPGMLEICRKASLSRHMARLAARLPAHYGFYPPAMLLPDQLDELVAALKKNKARADSGGGPITTYIIKPSAGTQGRGISLVQFPAQLSAVPELHSCVAQAYVARPLLLDGYKFDLRVYALVQSVDPLRIHLYDEGLARLATLPYAPPTPDNLQQPTMHLTNYAVNKGSAAFVSSDAAPHGGGSKRPLGAVLQAVAEAHPGATKEGLMAAIADVIIKTLLAVQPLLAHTYHTSLSAAHSFASCSSSSCSSSSPAPATCTTLSYDHVPPGTADPAAPCCCPPSLCFELLGFDIMFDQDLKPWLLEVNHSPSFASDSRLDRAIKGALLSRTMDMLAQSPEARKAFAEAEARAQSARLYSSPHGASGSPAAGITTAGGGSGGVGGAGRRALSATPRSSRLQAAAAAMEELAASSAALLAAGGGHVWGASGSSSNLITTTSHADTTLYSHGPRAAGVAPSAHLGGSSSGCNGSSGGGCGGGWDASANGAWGGWAGDACAEEGMGTGAAAGRFPVCGRYHLIFPSVDQDARQRHCQILQVAADLFPQQRCQCPWCARRRDIALLHSQQQHLALLARPAPALGLPPHTSGPSLLAANPHPLPQSQPHSHQLSGHLPARPVLSARSATHGSRRSCSASRLRPGSAAAACGSGSGSSSSASVGRAAGEAGAVEGGEAGAEAEADVLGRLAVGGSRKEADKRFARGRPPRPPSPSRLVSSPPAPSSAFACTTPPSGRSCSPNPQRFSGSAAITDGPAPAASGSPYSGLRRHSSSILDGTAAAPPCRTLLSESSGGSGASLFGGAGRGRETHGSEAVRSPSPARNLEEWFQSYKAAQQEAERKAATGEEEAVGLGHGVCSPHRAGAAQQRCLSGRGGGEAGAGQPKGNPTPQRTGGSSGHGRAPLEGDGSPRGGDEDEGRVRPSSCLDMGGTAARRAASNVRGSCVGAVGSPLVVRERSQGSAARNGDLGVKSRSVAGDRGEASSRPGAAMAGAGGGVEAAAKGSGPGPGAARAAAAGVPRVALLASGPRRGGGGGLSFTDLELGLLRMKTTALLSNRFVPVYFGGLGPGGGRPGGR